MRQLNDWNRGLKKQLTLNDNTDSSDTPCLNFWYSCWYKFWWETRQMYMHCGLCLVHDYTFSLTYCVSQNWMKTENQIKTWSQNNFWDRLRCVSKHLNCAHHLQMKLNKEKRELKGKGEREMEGRGRTSSYLELLSCNLLERRQERYKQKSQTDSFWLWGEWNISYLVAKWQSVLIVHNTATTLQRGMSALKSKKIPVVFLLPFLAIYFSLIFLHTPQHCILACFTLY